MDLRTFNTIRKIVKEQSGINLDKNKEALVSARVGKRMRKLGIQKYNDYLKHLLDDKSGQELVALLDVISTNVTSFFRESTHFDYFQKIINKWVDEGQERFRLWSAASSTGEEPYTIAISFMEAVKSQKLDMKILGTDISTNVLDQSREGKYEEKKVEPIPGYIRQKYFNKIKSPTSTIYEVKKNLKNMVMFRRLNLSSPPYPMKGPLDVIFNRNVMIYFDNPTREKMLNEMYKLLKSGGYLFVGHSESLTGLNTKFKIIRPSIYYKE